VKYTGSAGRMYPAQIVEMKLDGRFILHPNCNHIQRPARSCTGSNRKRRPNTRHALAGFSLFLHVHAIFAGIFPLITNLLHHLDVIADVGMARIRLDP